MFNHRRFTPLLLAAAFVLLITGDAFAWGPVTHTRLATELIGQLGLLPAAVAYALRRHATSFIFGNVAADVVLAKKLSRIKQYCHHWTTGFDLLERANSPRDQAFAYGYLCHLAADTVAHGHFIPHQLIISNTTLNVGHVYWEMRADALLDANHWRKFRQVMIADHEHHHDVLRGRLVHSLLPYQFNRKAFERINRAVAGRFWQTGISTLSRASRWGLSGESLVAYHADAIERMKSVLIDLDRSPVLRDDPNGNAVLRQVKRFRQQARILTRRGVSVAMLRKEAAASVAPAIMLPAQVA